MRDSIRMHIRLRTATSIWCSLTTAAASSSAWIETTASTSVGGSLIQTATPVNSSNSPVSEHNAIAGNKTACNYPPQPVSPASALWALIALAINAMTQRSGADRLDVLSPARSSPLVCLADVIVVVLWLVHGMRQDLGVKGSMYWYRKEMGLLREQSDRGLIQGIPAVSSFFFILGPLPQAIKAFGAVGLHWTKAWAALFLGAWCVEVVVRFSAGLARPTRVESAATGLESQASFLRKISLMVHQAAIVIQYCIWLWIMITLPRSEKFQHILALCVLLNIVCPTFFLIAIAFLPYVLGELGVFPSYVYTVAFWIVFEGLWFMMFIWYLQSLDKWVYITSEALAFLPGTVLFSIAIYVFSLLCTALLIYVDLTLARSGPQEEPRYNYGPPTNRALSRSSREDFRHPIANELWRFAERCSKALAKKAYLLSFLWEDISEDQNRRVLSITFALANLLFATLYYCILYDSMGTVKPSWTELLG